MYSIVFVKATEFKVRISPTLCEQYRNQNEDILCLLCATDYPVLVVMTKTFRYLLPSSIKITIRLLVRSEAGPRCDSVIQ